MSSHLPATASDDFPCPNCEAHEVGTFISDQRFAYGDMHLIAKGVEFFRCMACGLEFTGEDGEQKREQAVEDHMGAVS